MNHLLHDEPSLTNSSHDMQNRNAWTSVHVLTLSSEGADSTGHNLNDKSRISISSTPSRIELAINTSLTVPLLIRHQTTQPLFITIAPHVHAHLLFVGAHEARVDVKLEPMTDVHCYLMPQATQTLTLNCDVLKNARLRLFELGVHATKCLRAMRINLAGQHADFSYFGLDVLHSDEHKQSKLIISHDAPNTKSTQWFRGVYSGRALGSFVGQVIVQKGAAGSSAQQLYKSILMSDKAKAQVKPELVIFNHDIMASHGATIGELNEDALFYLQSRGIDEQNAKALLIESFTEEVLRNVQMPALKNVFADETAMAITAMLGASS